MPIFDTHAHYDSNGFKSDRDEVLSSLPAANVALVVNPGCDLPSSREAVELAERYPHVYAAVGIHPSDCDDFTEADIEVLRQMAAHEKVVAIGEIGLDYYWKDNAPKEFQELVFRRQIELALELDLPVIVHDREAHVSQAYMHHSTYKNAAKAPEVAAVVPLEHIVVETDSPYLTPVPFRGKRNDSRYLPYVIEKLAEWKGVTPEEMERITWENGKRLYGLA